MNKLLDLIVNEVSLVDKAANNKQFTILKPEDPKTEEAPDLSTLITKALERYAGNVSLAAQALGLSRSALYRRLQRHGL